MILLFNFLILIVYLTSPIILLLLIKQFIKQFINKCNNQHLKYFKLLLLLFYIVFISNLIFQIFFIKIGNKKVVNYINYLVIIIYFILIYYFDNYVYLNIKKKCQIDNKLIDILVIFMYIFCFINFIDVSLQP